MSQNVKAVLTATLASDLGEVTGSHEKGACRVRMETAKLYGLTRKKGSRMFQEGKSRAGI